MSGEWRVNMSRDKESLGLTEEQDAAGTAFAGALTKATMEMVEHLVPAIVDSAYYIAELNNMVEEEMTDEDSLALTHHLVEHLLGVVMVKLTVEGAGELQKRIALNAATATTGMQA